MLRDLSLLTSVTILDELEDVLARPKFGFKRADLHAIRHVLLRAADVVVLMSEDECARWVPSDPGDDHVDVQTIEGFWSLLKRGLGGVYHSVSEKYLQSYVDQYAFRYNHRKDRMPLFKTILTNLSSASGDPLASA